MDALSVHKALGDDTRFAIYRISELAELPLWVIHIAWPMTGLTWIVFLGEQFVDNIRILSGKETP